MDDREALDWRWALRLGERQIPAAAVADAGTAWRIERWRAQLGAEERWRAALASHGIAETELAGLLAAPDPLNAGPPIWATTFEDLWRAAADGPSPSFADDAPRFSQLLTPLIDHTIERLAAHARRFVDPEARLRLEPLLAGLRDRLATLLATIAGPTFVLELNIARLRGELRGASGAERFADFIATRAAPPASAALLRGYPVLVRLLVEQAELWLAATLRLLSRLCADWPAITAAIAPDPPPGALVAITGEAGDRHRGAQSVSVLVFESGWRLVYKPRSLAADGHFGALLDWINARGATPPLRRLRLLDRSDYGWMEFVAAAPCASLDGLGRFYRRQGAYLALFYLLDATDMHFENVIAAGEDPFPVDLEGLFHPTLPFVYPTDTQDASAAAEERASVLRTGLLPRRGAAPEPADQPTVDLSGLGGIGGQLSPQPLARWEDGRTDTMRLTYARQPLAGAANQPSLENAIANPNDYVNEVIAGFAATYDLLLAQRADLLDPDGPLTAFAADQVRVILRRSQDYALLLQRGHHPNLLRDAAERERLFDHLWLTIDEQPWLAGAIAAEADDLWREDIPVFQTTPASRDAAHWNGATLRELWPVASLDHVRARLGGLDAADRERQCAYIRLALLPNDA